LELELLDLRPSINWEHTLEMNQTASGTGTSSITADDEFSPTPTLSNWGFIGSGASTTYELQYAGTTVGLSETFRVSVIPEPESFAQACGRLVTLRLLARRKRAGGRIICS
jgi:hypothetical protein